MELIDVLKQYATPDPTIVSKLTKKWRDKNGLWQEMTLDYVGHADLTKILIEIDPLWTWEPLEIRDGAPIIHVQGDIASMWIKMTLLGKTMLGVGTCRADKDDAPKELIGDALRNAAMRYGIAVNLWSKSESSETPSTPRLPAPEVKRDQPSAPRQEKPAPKEGNKATQKQLGLINKLAKDKKINNILSRANANLPTPVNALEELSSKQASELISDLMADNPVEMFFKDPEEDF